MANKGGRTTLKRQLAPVFWQIKRKEGRFILRTHPGTHSKKYSYPLGIILRDVLKVTTNMHETRKVIDTGEVKVDNVVRYDIRFPVGLMDTLEFKSSQQIYRLVPKDSQLLYPIEVSNDEKSQKLLKIKSKNIVKGNKIQYGFHDGRTLLSEKNFSVGDTCLVTLPELEVVEHLKLQPNALAILTLGENAGKIGKIQEVKEGTFSLPKRVVIGIGSKVLELPIDMIMVVSDSNDSNPKIGVS